MIKISNVDYYYKKGKNIFSNLNLNLESGHIYGLLGRNGTGKSTLLKLMSGMIFAKSGEITALGESPARRLPSILTQLFYLPEEIDSPTTSMKKFVKYTAPFYVNFNYDDIRTYMDEFEVSYDQKMTSMSLGQRKKAMIAFALACNTSILLMDEPTNGLDIPSKSQFRKIISRAATEDRTIIISTHQVRDLENVIDTVVIIEGSGIIANASMQHIGDRLLFKVLDKDEVSIYEEGGIRGRWGVVENNTKQSSKIDIELFFNATIAKPEVIKNILTR